MKVKPTTIGLVLVALLLGLVTVVTVQTNEPRSAQTEEEEPQELFSFIEREVQSVRLETQTDLFEFDRTDAGWQMVSPEQTPASDASIAFLLNQMATARSPRSVTVAAADVADFGLDEPLATVEVTLENEETHRLVLGGYDFNQTSLYALVDPPEAAEELDVFLVPPNFENAVGRPYEEWKQPVAIEPEVEPEAEPEEAEAAPEPEASPEEAEATPEAEVSPTPEAE
ncbi:DUF4340 domain-containing protein [Egbenema bharatensis]|uniref:DUF4340 domain-containing protein n=1 Tax=Egbenema bharatensis TaxID=3463334 RepID=UPI003A8C4789